MADSEAEFRRRVQKKFADNINRHLYGGKSHAFVSWIVDGHVCLSFENILYVRRLIWPDVCG